jgi:hypothetical protein
MKIGGFEDGTDAKRGCLQLVVKLAKNRGVTARGLRETEQHPQRRRLTGSVGSQETGNRTGFDLERQIVDSQYVAVSFGQ